MRLYTLTKGQFALVFAICLLAFVIFLMVGLAGTVIVMDFTTVVWIMSLFQVLRSQQFDNVVQVNCLWLIRQIWSLVQSPYLVQYCQPTANNCGLLLDSTRPVRRKVTDFLLESLQFSNDLFFRIRPRDLRYFIPSQYRSSGHN